ncbi:MAG: PSD1 and planctomycete cytochrome C domain-containing protein [Bryobacteraceae bacterium]
MRYALVAVVAATLHADVPALIQAQCGGCHGGSAKMSGLDASSRAALLQGGSRGPAVVPGRSADSLLYQAIARTGDLKMPPGKKALSAADVKAVKEWIDQGAPWQAGAADAAAREAATWWSFRKPVKTKPPHDRANPVDAFLDTAAPAAPRQALIRRLSYDLHGLPPDPAEVEAFANDTDPGAYTKLVNRMLESPRYGERWGRMWLDIVRYADTGGYETDHYFANAWRYRDYVIRSFNSDKPYDVFVKEQIAADEIWPDDFDLDGSYVLPKSKEENLERRLGTALYTLGAMPVEFSFFGEQFRAEWQAEAVDMTGAAFLGLSLGCARCHDHKFDPISQRDYYRLSAIFAGSEDREIPITSQMRIFEYTRHQTRQVIADQLREQYKHLRPGDKDARETLLRKIGDAYVKAPEMYEKANLLVHRVPVPDTYVLGGGDWQRRGEKVEPGFPAALGAGPAIAEPVGTAWFIPRRRKALAEWIASPDHPLTARVMVNRVWQGHFGEGLVATPNDFGRQGEKPSNPELLDWLAVELMEHGWSLKHLHRVILESKAYRSTRDPMRLDADSLRDAVLAAAGALNTKMFGPPVAVRLSEDERDGMRDMSQWPVHPDAREHDRRSVYLFVKRSFRLPMMETFDAPDSSQSCARREVSTVAPQALTLMNSEWMVEQAERFAARIESSKDPVEAAWRIAFGRAPSAEERGKAREVASRHGLPRLCLLIFNMSEFVYVD